MCYEESLRKCQKLDELFQLWKSKEKGEIPISAGKTIQIDHKQDGFITDGIVNQEIWGWQGTQENSVRSERGLWRRG